ncbi:MAG: hypothetical protein LBU89_08060 [Fibromonadaceae bacterium]|jgi:hypothetical protein|nr:hypothetical protein [Fibromonadaceae bacterium]
MKKFLFAVFALFATQAFAIIGIGAHYVTNLGTLKGEVEKFPVSVGPQSMDIELHRKEVSTLQGLGFKLWLDILPFIDVEGTFNVAATGYTPYLVVPMFDDPIYLEYSPDAPYNMVIDRASPIYGLFSGDLSVTYPFDLVIVRPYAGLGISYMASIPLVDKKFIKSMEPALVNIFLSSQDPNADPNADYSKMISKELSNALKNADYKTGIGGHAIVGARFKLPLIPIAAYTNAKYYFGGSIDPKFNQGIVFELGGGFAL